MTEGNEQRVDILKSDGERLVSELKLALESEDRESVLAALKEIGDTIHSRWGSSMTVSVSYEEGEAKYQVNLSSGTRGTRLFVDMKPGSKYEGSLIFPNVNLSHKQNGRTLADAFEEVFGSSAENIQTGDKPYYVVRL